MDVFVYKEPLGEMLSHVVSPLVPVALALKAIRVAAETVSVCVAGAEPPAAALNVKEVGLTVNEDAVACVRASVTGMVVVCSWDVTEIDPLYVPALSEPGATDTVMVLLVYWVPVGEMLSQFTELF